MNLEQQKIELIRWINSVNDKVVLDHLYSLKNATTVAVPEKIMELLRISAETDLSDRVEHTSVKDLLKNMK